MEPQNINTTIGFSRDDKICGYHMLLNHAVNIKLILYILYVGAFPALGQSHTNIAELYFSCHTRDIPAYAPFAEHSQASFTFRNDFCVRELMYKSLDLHLAKDWNVFHFIVSHDGYARFGEVRAEAGYARRFGQRFSISLKAIYIAQHAEHYRGLHSFTIDLSSHCQITPDWGVAVELFNPIRMRYGITGHEIIPMVFTLQVHHRWNDRLLAYILLRKRLPGGFEAGGGLWYRPREHLLLTGACSLQHIGIGVYVPWRHLLVGIQTAWHFRISFSNAATAQYLFNL